MRRGYQLWWPYLPGCVPRAVTGMSGCHLVDAGRRNLLSPWRCCFHQGGALSSSHQTMANAAQSPYRVFFPSFALISWHYWEIKGVFPLLWLKLVVEMGDLLGNCYYIKGREKGLILDLLFYCQWCFGETNCAFVFFLNCCGGFTLQV